MLSSRLLKWSLYATATFLLLVLCGTMLGLGLPADHSVSRAILLRQPVQTVWQTIVDPIAQPVWRKDIRYLERLPNRNGRPMWRERYRNGRSLTLETIEIEPPRLWVQRVADPRAPFTGTWTLRLESYDGGTRVFVHETANVPNPFFRFVARYLVGHARSIESYLRFLSARFGETVVFSR